MKSAEARRTGLQASFFCRIIQVMSRIVVALLIAAGGMFAQSAARRPAFDAFEVASIKPADPDSQGGRYITMPSPNRFVVRNYTLRRLVGAAYNLNPRQISGGPAWAESDRYDILAQTPGSIRPSLDEQMEMLKKLLAERFKLVFHREAKELSAYALTIAKGGMMMKESTAPGDAPAELINTVFPDHIRLPARNATMAQFASMMQRAVLDRPMLDRTGLSGKYDFDLEWAYDETQFGGQLPAVNSDAPPRPDLFAALRQQLGLKLEATRGSVQVVVIDSVERPSAN